MIILTRFDQFIEKISSWLLVVMILTILFLSSGSIFLRWMNWSQLWIEPLVRHLVFFSAFLGGVVATGRGTHIRIDIIGKYFESLEQTKALLIIRAIIGIVSFVILSWLFFASYEFMKMELQYGKAVFWGIHSGILVGFIPVGWALIGYRFLYHSILSISELFRGEN